MVPELNSRTSNLDLCTVLDGFDSPPLQKVLNNYILIYKLTDVYNCLKTCVCRMCVCVCVCVGCVCVCRVCV